jgi:hypothetical protein
MAKQTFTTGQVLTAAQMTSLQQTAMGGGSTTAKTASYVLVAADAGTVVQMNSASATTITVNTALFSQGDTVEIQNVGAGVCTVTAGTATVNTSSTLALKQYDAGSLYFNSTSAAIFFASDAADASGGKVLQVVNATYGTQTNNSTSTFADTGLTATITPTSATSKVLVLVNQSGLGKDTNDADLQLRLVRDATTLILIEGIAAWTNSSTKNYVGGASASYLDSPATTSATTYKTTFCSETNVAKVVVNANSSVSTITLLEIGA